MEVKDQARLRFFGIDILHVDFNLFKKVDEKAAKINFNLEPRVFYPKDSPMGFQILMKIDLEVEKHFRLSFLAVGSFSVKGENSPEIKKQFVNANAPAIMFPYIRSFITTLTSNLGNSITPIILPTKFFKGELQELSDSDELEESILSKSIP